MIDKYIINGLISILPDGQIQVREDTVIVEDGKELSRTYHREVLEPGQDVSDKSNRLQIICGAVWTPEVIAAYEVAKKAREEAMLADIQSRI